MNTTISMLRTFFITALCIATFGSYGSSISTANPSVSVSLFQCVIAPNKPCSNTGSFPKLNSTTVPSTGLSYSFNGSTYYNKSVSKLIFEISVNDAPVIFTVQAPQSVEFQIESTNEYKQLGPNQYLLQPDSNSKPYSIFLQDPGVGGEVTFHFSPASTSKSKSSSQ